jgi:hypothetical protein
VFNLGFRSLSAPSGRRKPAKALRVHTPADARAPREGPTSRGGERIVWWFLLIALVTLNVILAAVLPRHRKQVEA